MLSGIMILNLDSKKRCYRCFLKPANFTIFSKSCHIFPVLKFFTIMKYTCHNLEKSYNIFPSSKVFVIIAKYI